MNAALPGLVVLLAVIVCAVPWGLPDGATFILPLITATPIFYLSARGGQVVPAWLAFLAGVATDILTAGPLGYWALIFLLTHNLAGLTARTSHGQGFAGLWLAFALTMATVAAVGWGLASLYFVRFIDWQPMLIGLAVATGLFPLVAWPLGRVLGHGRARPGGGVLRARS